MNVTKEQIVSVIGELQLENIALRNQVAELTEKLNTLVREVAEKDAAQKPVE